MINHHSLHFLLLKPVTKAPRIIRNDLHIALHFWYSSPLTSSTSNMVFSFHILPHRDHHLFVSYHPNIISKFPHLFCHFLWLPIWHQSLLVYLRSHYFLLPVNNFSFTPKFLTMSSLGILHNSQLSQSIADKYRFLPHYIQIWWLAKHLAQKMQSL